MLAMTVFPHPQQSEWRLVHVHTLYQLYETFMEEETLRSTRKHAGDGEAALRLGAQAHQAGLPPTQLQRRRG